jgi:Flp pilus assembly secretin CpaC
MTRHGGWLAVSLLGWRLPAICANDGSPVDLAVTVGKSLILDTPADLRRVSVANGDLAEALAVNPREVLINGKAPGETSVILWQQDGARTLYNLTVRQSTARIEAVQGSSSGDCRARTSASTSRTIRFFCGAP